MNNPYLELIQLMRKQGRSEPVLKMGTVLLADPLLLSVNGTQIDDALTLRGVQVFKGDSVIVAQMGESVIVIGGVDT